MKKTVIAFLLLGVGLSLVAMEKEKLEIVDQILANCSKERQRDAECGGFYSIRSDLSFIIEIRAKFLDNIQASVTMINGRGMGWCGDGGRIWPVEDSVEEYEQKSFEKWVEILRCLENAEYCSSRLMKILDLDEMSLGAIRILNENGKEEHAQYKDLLEERLQLLNEILEYFKI